MQAAAESGGGSGARAAARFAAGKSSAGSGTEDGPGPGGRAAGASRSLRRSAWVQDVEGVQFSCCWVCRHVLLHGLPACRCILALHDVLHLRAASSTPLPLLPPAAAPQRLSDVSRRGFRSRWRLVLPGENGQELGRVLGGGVVPGSLTLVGGEPGVGKSTLLLQMAAMLTQASTSSDAQPAQQQQQQQPQRPQDVQQPAAPAQQEGEGEGGAPGAAGDRQAPSGGATVLYVSGEESVEQIGSRAERMGPAVGSNPSIFVYSATRLDAILDEIIRLQPAAVVVDSIQTVYLDEVSSSAGSVTQVRGGQGMGGYVWHTLPPAVDISGAMQQSRCMLCRQAGRSCSPCSFCPTSR